MKISRPAVWMLVVLWATVLLVPSLNFLLRLQLRSQESVLLSVWPVAQELTPQWEKVAKRFPGNKSVLYMASITPPLQEMILGITFDEMRSEAKSSQKTNPPSGESKLESLSTVEKMEKVRDLEWRENARRLEQLRKKFPDDAFLVAAQLQVMRKGLRTERVGGELSDARSPEERAGQASPERREEKTNFSPADFQKALELCALGQRLAPENGYFDWLECYFLMHSWRDEAAFKALEAVARKKEFDDYTKRESEMNLEAQSVASGRRLAFEEKIVTVALIGTWNGAYQRELARILSWASIKARRRGDHEQAMYMMVTQARAYRQMREKSRDVIPVLVFIAMESLAWHGTSDGERPPEGTREQTDAWHRKKLTEYVTLHGRPELAIEAAQAEAGRKKFLNRALDWGWQRETYGIALSTYAPILWLWALDVVLLILLPLAALVLLLMFGISRSSAVRQRLRWEESAAKETPSAREVWRGTLAATGLPALMLAVCTFAVGKSLAILWEVGPALFNERLQELLVAGKLWPMDSDGGLAISAWDFWNWGLNLSTFETPWRAVLLWTPLVFGTLYAARRATEWQWKENGVDKRGLASRAAGLVLSLALALCWFSLAMDIWPEEQAWRRMVALVVALLCAGLMLLGKYRLWRSLPCKRAAARYGLRLLQRNLFTWLVAGSALYLVTLAASVPLRQQADAGFARFLTEGDIHTQGFDSGQ